MAKKSQLQARLVELGKWDDYVERREALKAEGKSPQQASKQAIAEIEHELNEAPPQQPEDPKEKAFQQLRKQVDAANTAGYAKQIGWIADNLILEWHEMEPKEVPCLAALAQLYFIRKTRSEKEWWFSVWTKLVPSRSVIDKTGSIDDSDDETDAELERELGQVLDTAAFSANLPDGFDEAATEQEE